MSKTLIQSYPLRKYFVSTIYRQSSAALYPISYYETLAWEWDEKTMQTGTQLDVQWQESQCRAAALVEHARVCAELAERHPEFKDFMEDQT